MLTQHAILYFCAFLTDLAVAIWSFALTRRAAELGASPSEIGVLAAAWIGAYGACALVSGRVSDRLGRRGVAMTGCLIVAGVAAACAMTTRVGWLVTMGLAFGAGLSGFWPSVIAWLGEGVTGPALAARLTKFSVAWNCGLLVGFGVAGVIYEWSHTAAFVVPAGVFVVIAGLMMVRLPETTEAARPAIAPYQQPPVGRGFRKTAWLANFAVSAALGGAGTMFYDLAAQLGIGADVNGAMLAVGRGAAMVAFVGLQMAGFWRVRLWPLWVAQAVAAGAVLWLGFAERTWMFVVVFAVTGLVSGYAYQASVFFSLEETSEKGKGGGFHEAILGMAMCAGPIAAGLVGGRWGLRGAYVFCAAGLGVFVVAQMILVFVRRQASGKVPA